LPERFVVVDGTLSEAVLEKKIWAAIADRLSGLNHTGKRTEGKVSSNK
jgi:hypothetical protein